MNIHYFIGSDISKTTLDWAAYHQHNICFQIQTTNSVEGIKSALRFLRKLPDWNSLEVVFCMEHTGIVRHEVARFEYGYDPFG